MMKSMTMAAALVGYLSGMAVDAIPTAMMRAVDDLQAACAADVASLCSAPRRPSPDGRPFSHPFSDSVHDFDSLIDSLLGGRPAFPPQPPPALPTAFSPFAPSDPFQPLRSMVDADPFLRMAATPPSVDASPSLLAQSAFHDLDAMVDDMLASALRFSWEFSDCRNAMGAAAAAAEAAREEIGAVPAAEEEKLEGRDAEAADVAEAALEAMVNAFLGHAESASSSSASSDDSHGPASRSADETEGNEELFDPITMAKLLAKRGRTILREVDSEDGGRERADDMSRRRRLTEEGGQNDEDTLQRLALRLAEVEPMQGMPSHFTFVRISSVRVRVVVMEPIVPLPPRPPPLRLLPATPRLNLGCPRREACLWDAYDDGTVSIGCAAILDLLKEAHAVSLFSINDDPEIVLGVRTCSWTILSNLLIAWVALLASAVALWKSSNEDEDEDEDEDEEGDEDCAQVYVALLDQPEVGTSKETKIFAGIPVMVV